MSVHVGDVVEVIEQDKPRARGTVIAVGGPAGGQYVDVKLSDGSVVEKVPNNSASKRIYWLDIVE